jgi:hypothetical protein
MGRRIQGLIVVAGLGLAVGMATPSGAHAQTKQNRIAIVGGVYTFNEFQGDTDPVIGARWTSFFAPNVGAGASFDWIPAGNGVTVLGYDVDLVLRVPTRTTTEPFFTLGAGGITFAGFGTDTYFAGILGAGVRTSVAENVGLVFEARDRIYHVPSDLINDFHFTGGVEFFF